MQLKYIFLLIAFFFQGKIAVAQESPAPEYKHFMGSTFFMLFNFLPEPPQYYQLNYGHRFNAKNIMTLETITWTYAGPLGRPYGPDYEDSATNFPGKVRAFGVGLSYKRFLRKAAYIQIHTTAMRQQYLDLSGTKIQSGFQLFNTLRLGYQFRFFDNRFFMEPSIACTYWPINTNMPASFQLQEDKFSNYFIGEPGLHFGVNF